MAAGTHILRFAYLTLFLMGAVGACAHNSTAEFQLTKSPGVYEETRRALKIVVTSTPQEHGLFVIAGPPLAPEEFALGSWTGPTVASVFIRFSQGSAGPQYTDLITATQAYRINGNVSFQLTPHTIIGIDNNNAYLTVEFNDSPDLAGAAMIGFSGVNEILQEAGEQVALVSASNSDDDAILYTLRSGRLYDGEKEVQGVEVGRFVRLRNECLNDGSLVLRERDVRRVQDIKNEDERFRVLSELVQSGRTFPVLRDFLVLSAVPEQAVLLDYRKKSVHRMTPKIPKGINQRVCVIADLASGGLSR